MPRRLAWSQARSASPPPGTGLRSRAPGGGSGGTGAEGTRVVFVSSLTHYSGMNQWDDKQVGGRLSVRYCVRVCACLCLLFAFVFWGLGRAKWCDVLFEAPVGGRCKCWAALRCHRRRPSWPGRQPGPPSAWGGAPGWAARGEGPGPPHGAVQLCGLPIAALLDPWHQYWRLSR